MTKAIRKRSGGAIPVLRPTILEILLDETGSMACCHAETVSGFNAFLGEQRHGEGLCLLTLTKFDTAGQRTPYTDLDVRFAPEMTMNMFVPGQSTNLYDSIGLRIRNLDARLAGFDPAPHVLFVVMTDGADNASRSFDPAGIASLVRAREACGWTFVFLGATTDALQIGAKLGFAPGNTRRFSTAEMQRTMTDLGQATKAYRASRQTASGSERAYFSRVGLSNKY